MGALSALTAAALAAWLLPRWLERELSVLTDAARRMAAGDLDIRTRASGRSGTGDLGDALDRLAENLSRAMTELRAERDLVAGILDGMQEGVLLIRADGSIGRVNPMLRDMLLLGTAAVERPVIEVVRHATLLELLDRVRASRLAKSAEIELAGPPPRRLLVRAAPLQSKGAAAALLAVFVDVTDLRRLESMRRDFVANVSHELRTPVTAMQSAAETLRSGALSDHEAAIKFVDMIERNADRLRSLIDDLLELSRIEAKELPLRPEPVDLLAVVQHVTGAARERAARQRAELAIDVAPDARALSTDRRAVEQVLTNLVENAVKYCPDARITVRARRPEGGGVMVLQVVDTGPGIEARHLSRIFERFYRVDASRSRELGGTGLGLSIVKHLVESLGGTVTVASEVGKGTTFTVEIPETLRDPSPEASRLSSPAETP